MLTASAAIAEIALTSIGICPRVSVTIQNDALDASIAGICNDTNAVPYSPAVSAQNDKYLVHQELLADH